MPSVYMQSGVFPQVLGSSWLIHKANVNRDSLEVPSRQAKDIKTNKMFDNPTALLSQPL